MNWPRQVRLARIELSICAAALAAACGSAGAGPAAISPPVASTPVPGSLWVDAATSRGTISPLVYGTNFGPWGVVTTDLQAAADTAGLRLLRYPGGNWGDQNNIQPWQLDQFAELARRMGAEISLSVRLRGGTPEAAAELVRYAGEMGYDIRYWSIGNEPELYGDYDTVRHNREWRAIAQAMRAVDDSIVLIGPEVTQYTGNPASDPRDSAGRDWLREFLQANGDLVDIVSIHRYPFPAAMGGPPASSDDLRRNPAEWDHIIPRLREVIRETTGRDLPVAVTEVNSHWTGAYGGEGTPDSFNNAVWWAAVLGRLIDQQVMVVNHFALQSGASIGGWGLLGRSQVRPTYYVYQLYQHFGQELLPSASPDTDVSVAAARRDDGAITLMAANLASEARQLPLHVAGAELTRLTVWRLDAEHLAARASEGTYQPGMTVTLPGHSVSLFIFER
jgi:alpha-L-arabinofuranosidase